MGRLRAVRKHFWSYARGVLRGHPGARIEAGVKLGGPGTYRLDRGCTVSKGAQMWVGEGATLHLSKGSKIGMRTIVNVESGLEIGPDVRISWEVQILDTDFHWTTSPTGRRRAHTAPIVIERKVLIGTRCLVLKGVTLGEGAVVGAGSVVRRDVPPRTVVAGNPAVAVGEVSDWGSAVG
ncbi:Hexapeptide repeat of succinyl-transferase [Plantibacter sp. VKM Ac-1784]|uniref:Hexapeptide repeat of succinyl-transferase n=1 Tax=Plantibacter elymi (nom. nud.) TaxID=199708 RepID=A0ABY1RH63_9MICO|nr:MULTISPECIES: acyltransferase [Plantibacter]CAH0184973.1 Galactoside O-acetyltransferase [Plantibacter cousiniae]SMQ72671.1 Hexapeptide repeat of succinyl-transferase [Plantibacter sp. VKM Ac-1784]